MPDTRASRVIVAIHGLGKKPPEMGYAANWRTAMTDGLERNLGFTGPLPAYEMVYWGNWNHADNHPDEAYVPGDGSGPYPRYRDRWRHLVLREVLEQGGSFADASRRLIGLDEAGDALLRKALGDLELYYADGVKRAELRALLYDALGRHVGKRIMLVAHSMGSIVAYDVLRELGRDMPDAAIEHLVTIGSPLGLPHVVDKIGQEWGRPRVPTIVRRWSNLAERRDPIALDTHLASDYPANDRGVEIVDDLVINSYPGRPGPWRFHAAYGYLRTPEMSDLSLGFI